MLRRFLDMPLYVHGPFTRLTSAYCFLFCVVFLFTCNKAKRAALKELITERSEAEEKDDGFVWPAGRMPAHLKTGLVLEI